MSTEVKAEFPSIDAAETASRYMRTHLDGIEHIHLISRKRMQRIAGVRRLPLERIEPDERRDAVLSMTMQDDQAAVCAGMMRSLGGMRVQKQKP